MRKGERSRLVSDGRCIGERAQGVKENPAPEMRVGQILQNHIARPAFACKNLLQTGMTASGDSALSHDIEEGTGLPVGLQVDTSPAKRPQRIRLEGRYVALEPLDAARHADSLYTLSAGRANDALWTYLPSGPFADAAAYRANIATLAASPDPLFYAIVEKASGRAIGHAGLMRIDEKNRSIEVGFILYTPVLQRTIGATEAMYLLMAYVFDTLGYRRYEWKCNDLNAPSMQAARRLGFTYEGTFRQMQIVKGRNRDTAWFSMLDREWPVRKRGYQRWLDAENFDVAGKQKTSLTQFIELGQADGNN